MARSVAIDHLSKAWNLKESRRAWAIDAVKRGEYDTEAAFRSLMESIYGASEKVRIEHAVMSVGDLVPCPLCKTPLGSARGEAPQVVHRDDGIWVCSDCFDCSTDGGYTTTRRQAAGVSAFGGGAFAIDPRKHAAIAPSGARPVDVQSPSRPQAPPDAEALKPFERRCIAIAELVLFCEGSTDVTLRGESRASEWHVPEIYRPSIRIERNGDNMVRAIATGVTTGWAVEMEAPIPYSEETVGALLRGLLVALCWAVDEQRAGLASGANGLALPNGVRAVELGHFEVPPSNDEQTAREEAAAQTRKCRTPLGARRYLIEQGFPAARITEDVVEVLRYLILREGTSAAGAKEQLERMNQVQFQKKIAEIRGDGLGLERLSTPLKAKGGRIHLTSTVDVSGLDIARLVLGGTIRLTDSIDTEHEPGKVAVRSSSAVVVGPPWLDEWLGEPSKDDQATAGASVVIGGDP